MSERTCPAGHPVTADDAKCPVCGLTLEVPSPPAPVSYPVTPETVDGTTVTFDVDNA